MNDEIISTSEKNLLLSSKTPARPLHDAGLESRSCLPLYALVRFLHVKSMLCDMRVA